MKKRALILLFALVMVLSLTACGSKDNANTPGSETSAQSTTQPTESDSPTENNVSEQPKETQEQPSETEAGNVTSGQPSDDLFAFQASVDGNLISAPCAVKDLEALGYSFGDKSGNSLENNYTTSGLMKNADGNYVSVEIYNTSGSAKTFAECEIDDIYFKKNNLEGQTLVFAKGITFGASEDDIIKAFGEPSKRSDIDDSITLSYYIDGKDIKNAVKFYLWKGELNEVDLCTDK